MAPTESLVWMSGELVLLSQANIPIRAHVSRYGSNVFTGMRAYPREGGIALMRFDNHIDRLFESMAIYRMLEDFKWTKEEIRQAILETLLANSKIVKEPYVNINVYRGMGGLNVNPQPCTVEVSIDILDWGKYLPDPCAVKVSTWSINAPNTTPPMAKCGGNYPNRALMKMEAHDYGADEALGLTTQGCVSDASGGNIFIGYQGELWTPPTIDCGLPGITRRTIFTLADDLGIAVRRSEHIPHEMLFACDEAFLCGSAAQVTSIGKIDYRELNAPGKLTKAIADRFLGIAAGRLDDEYQWMTEVKFG